VEVFDRVQAAALTLFGVIPFGDDDSRAVIEVVVLTALALAVALTIRLTRSHNETDHLAERIGIVVGAATIFCEVTGAIRLCCVLALVTAMLAVCDERGLRRCSMCELLGRTSHIRR
jgi:hypothetical protein